MNGLEKMVYEYIIDNSYPDGNEWCTMRQMSKTLREFPNTLRPVVEELASRGVIIYNKNSSCEYMGYAEPDGDWAEADLYNTINTFNGEY